MKPNTKTDQNIIIEDFYPTILEMAGAKPKGKSQVIDGVSFVSTLKGAKTDNEKRPIIWNYPNDWGVVDAGTNFFTGIKLGDYKFIYFYDNRPAELYNIKEDIGEKHNIIKEKPEIAKKLAKQLSDALKEMNAQRPSKPDGTLIPYPDEVIK